MILKIKLFIKVRLIYVILYVKYINLCDLLSLKFYKYTISKSILNKKNNNVHLAVIYITL